MTDLDEIKSRIDIVEYVSQYVQLKKAGHSYKGLCPFHKEKSPSFMVSPDKGIAYCFGCRKGGDIFAFAMEVERVDFADALRSLAKRAGVQIEQHKREDVDRKDRLYRMQEVAQAFFEEQLAAPGGQGAREYLQGRGISTEEIKRFGMGYAPDSYDALSRRLRDRGFTEAELRDSGLVTTREGGNETHDKFRERVTFAIRNAEGDIVGFAGRALRSDQQPKYLNSPETPIYRKSDVLYHYSQARNAMREQGRAVVVEGYMDVIACHRAGIAAVATCGTALTERQARLLKRAADTVVLCFDNDGAGREAAMRNAVPALREGLLVTVADLGTYKDPGEAAENGAAGQLREALFAARDAVSVFCQRLSADYNVQLPEGRRAFLRSLSPVYAALSLASEREVAARTAAQALGISAGSVAQDLQGAFRSAPEVARPPERSGESRAAGHARLVLGILTNHPEWWDEFGPLLQGAFLAEGFEKNVYNALTDAYNRRVRIFDPGCTLTGEDLEQAKIIALDAERSYEHLSEAQLRQELAAQIGHLRQGRASADRAELFARMREAKGNDPAEYERLLREYNALL